MASRESLKRYRIKLPTDLGKPLYIQPIDVKKQFFKEIVTRIGVLVFLLFGSSIALVMAYGAWQTHDVWHGIIALLFSGFLLATFMSVRSFLHVTLYVVADKGIARYTLRFNERVVDAELFYFSPSQRYEVAEGYVDPHSLVSKKGYKVKATWYEGNRNVFTMSYLRGEEPLLDKEALEHAVKAFQIYAYAHQA